MFHFCFQYYFLPMHKSIAIGIATCAVYGVIRLTGPRAVIMGFVALLSLTYLSILFRRMGLMFEESFNIKRIWLNSPSTGKYARKVLQAQPELRIDVGNFYYVERSTVLTLLLVVFNFTVNLLIAY
ncbi:unnamed protein product [Orchesella dallaii]|uniref:Uncharacterized protein n=1 Tax=Orchesella dallaii TaxID=48710 RepID=A0ABP1PQ78_9HEXA